MVDSKAGSFRGAPITNTNREVETVATYTNEVRSREYRQRTGDTEHFDHFYKSIYIYLSFS